MALLPFEVTLDFRVKPCLKQRIVDWKDGAKVVLPICTVTATYL